MVLAVTNEQVLSGREEVEDALLGLLQELRDGAGEDWENPTLERYLEAFGALLGGIENVYINTGKPLPESPWTLVARALLGARYYE